MILNSRDGQEKHAFILLYIDITHNKSLTLCLQHFVHTHTAIYSKWSKYVFLSACIFMNAFHFLEYLLLHNLKRFTSVRV